MNDHTPEFYEAEAQAYNDNPSIRDIYYAAAEVEGPYNGILTRAEEICLFAQKMHYESIGIATCVCFADISSQFAKVLHAKGIKEVHTAICKVGSMDKTFIGIPEEQKILPYVQESLCNPLMQARIFNEAGCQLNVMVGLCVGHDILFTQYSNAPVTTLATKDRVLGHNPCAIFKKDHELHARLFEKDYPAPREMGAAEPCCCG